MPLERLWAGWRTDYVAGVAAGDRPGCVFCGILASDASDDELLVVWRGERAVVLLNLYPYTSGHLLVLPTRHVAELEDVTGAEAAELWSATSTAVRALKSAYAPDGINVGANLGRAAGAGVPGHFHVHALPRWAGDTNFMTSIADARVLPESLGATLEKLRDSWHAL